MAYYSMNTFDTLLFMYDIISNTLFTYNAITDFVVLELNYSEWYFDAVRPSSHLINVAMKSKCRVVITLQIRITLLRQHA